MAKIMQRKTSFTMTYQMVEYEHSSLTVIASQITNDKGGKSSAQTYPFKGRCLIVM